jgi:hypothetical protein
VYVVRCVIGFVATPPGAFIADPLQESPLVPVIVHVVGSAFWMSQITCAELFFRTSDGLNFSPVGKLLASAVFGDGGHKHNPDV